MVGENKTLNLIEPLDKRGGREEMSPRARILWDEEQREYINIYMDYSYHDEVEQ